jgi:hypothetical protein
VEVREIANPSKAVLIEPAEGGLSHPLAVAFSADGVQLAVAYTNEIIVWEWRVRRPVRRVYEVLSNDYFNTFSIAFDTEGKLVAADMYAAHIWDISEKPRPVGSVELQAMHTRTDYTTTLSPNGRFVATTYGFASAKNRLGAKTAVWELQPTHIMASACQRLSVCLSGTEWRREFDTEPQRKTCKALGVSVPGDCQE